MKYMKRVSPAPPAALVARVLGARDPTQNQNPQQTRHERREHVCPAAVCLSPVRNYIDLFRRHEIKQSTVGIFTTSCFPSVSTHFIRPEFTKQPKVRDARSLTPCSAHWAQLY